MTNAQRYPNTDRSMVGVAFSLWTRPLRLCLRYYVLGVFSYLLGAIGLWALSSTDAGIITTAADARYMVRTALLNAGPAIAIALLVAHLIAGGMVNVAGGRDRGIMRWMTDLEDVVYALRDTGAQIAYRIATPSHPTRPLALSLGAAVLPMSLFSMALHELARIDILLAILVGLVSAPLIALPLGLAAAVLRATAQGGGVSD